MKNNKFTPEKFLEKGKELSLSTIEREGMKAELLTYANYHGIKTLMQKKASWSSLIWVRSLAAASFALLLFVGTGYAASHSLPGEPLYAIKVHVVEELIAYTKTEPHELIAYQISLMETRFQELQQLADQAEKPAPEDLVELTQQIKEHTADITETLEVPTFTHKNKIAALSKLSGVSQAQSEIVQNEVDLAMAITDIQDNQEATSDALREAVEDFVEVQSTEFISNYLNDHLTSVGEIVTASTTNTEVRDLATQHLSDVNEALIDGDITEAIISTLEAEQAIAIDSYLEESEALPGNSN